ncbi:oxidoreductase [Hypoxylon rubiginosum]|uniref:Oxidoreductase n=1 Tax=Hypoxylon rubiginosum TaxID=110542 RepID=A0ACB9YJW4_9PEZI|nr:oxidoreductase [Hypoxylon rubiginosum]
MAEERLLKGIIPFLDDVPTVPLRTIPLAGLRSGDQAVAKITFTACQELGFFLLDLRGDSLGNMVIEEIDERRTKELSRVCSDATCFKIPLLPMFPSFKPRGQAKIETSEPDRFEWFNIGQDGLIGNTKPQSLPPLVHDQLSLFHSFLDHGPSIVGTISSTLAMQLGLPANASASLQRPTKPSGTVARFIEAFASPETEDLRTSMIHHTDFGTIALFANVLGGLQILSSHRPPEDNSAWLWVRPQPGCLIVNLGDAMVQWTGSLLRSNVHRTNFAPGEQRFPDRYSLALLVRPEREASMKNLTGAGEGGEDGDLTAWEWEVKKAMASTRGAAAEGVKLIAMNI